MKLRSAIVGCGQIAANAHAPYYKNHPDVELIAVADPDLDRAVAFAAKYDVPWHFDGLDALLGRGEVDAISICVPPRLHASLTVQALRAGVHVLCEKPAATNAADAEVMAAEAVAADRVLTFGFHYRYLAEAAAMRALVDDGVLGDIYAVQLLAMRRRGIPAWGNFIDRRVAGGGPLLDIGVHVLDLGLWLAGFPTPMSALCVTHHRMITQQADAGLVPPGHLVEDMATGLIRCAGGVSVQIDTSFLANITDDETTQARLLGSDGGIEVFPPRLVREQSTLLGRTELVIPGKPWDHQTAYRRQIDRFVAACLGREAPLVTPQEAVVGQHVIDLLYASASRETHESGQPVQDDVRLSEQIPVQGKVTRV